MEISMPEKPGLFTAVGIGVGCVIGSGWLFAAYYAAQYTGPASYISWVIGAVLALILALLLAEIASMYKQKALFTRLLNVSHNNPDLGFVIAISSWLGFVIVIPAEASATIQYLSTAFPSLTSYIFIGQQHTILGSVCIVGLICVYMLLNYWGIKSLAKASNIIGIIKIIIPILTSIILMVVAFHPSNFTAHGFAPYGYSHVFSAVVTCGIFYAFYGFTMIAMYSSELKNPKKNIPRALVFTVLLCLFIYLLLQTAFIGALPTAMVAKGWSALNFTSPLAQLLLLLNINFLAIWAIVLYADSAISPSGTGIIYLGSASRTLTGMARDKEVPKFFNQTHSIYNLSRRSLIFTTFVCCIVVFFFKNWRSIMVVVTVFQLISCMAIPVAFIKLRVNKPNSERIFKVKFGLTLSVIIYLVVCYLLTQATVTALVLALILHVLFFLFYAITFYGAKISLILKAFRSASSAFAYIILSIIFGYFNKIGLLTNDYIMIAFFILYSINLWALLKQRSYNVVAEHKS